MTVVFCAESCQNTLKKRGLGMYRRIFAYIFVGLLTIGPPNDAYSGELDTNFTFKRVKPPTSGTRKRITIQITPQDTVQTKVAKVVAEAPTSGSAQFEWFWNEISPALDAAGPGRFLAALDHLAGSPDAVSLQGPSFQLLRSIAEAHGTDILLATIGKDVSPALVLAVIGVESRGKEKAISPAGAVGLMQLTPATAALYGVEDREAPTDNINAGVSHLGKLMERYGKDPILALAAYNAGETAVAKHDGVPPFAETRGYVPKVLAAFRVAAALCRTQPLLATDGCVFNLTGD
jgi:hypothetical protein